MVEIQPRQVCGSNFKRFGSASWARALRKWFWCLNMGGYQMENYDTPFFLKKYCYTFWTWGDTIRIPWGDTMGVPYLPKKPLVTLQVGVALMLFSDGQMVNVSQPLATKTPWSPKFDTVDGTLGALPPMFGKIWMISIEIWEILPGILADSKILGLFLWISTHMFDFWTSEWMLKHGLWGLFIILLSLPIAYAGMPRPSRHHRFLEFWPFCIPEIIQHIIYASL